MYQLQNLSQGSRIAYIRDFHGLTQSELGIKCGFKPECAGTRIAQYEANKRSPKHDIQMRLADALDVDAKFLGRYDLRDMNDIYYLRSWMDIVEKGFMLQLISRMTRSQAKYMDFCTGSISREVYLFRIAEYENLANDMTRNNVYDVGVTTPA